MTNEQMTFRQAYGVLQRHAETLRNQSEPNIDDLLSIVEESVSAYRVCKDRIDAVEKALEKALTDVGADATPAGENGSRRAVAPGRTAGANVPTVPAASQTQAGGSTETDEDIPF